MSGRGHPVGGGIIKADDGRGIILPGDTVSESTVFRVQGRYGVWVSGSTPTDAAQGGNWRETALGDHNPTAEIHAPIIWISQLQGALGIALSRGVGDSWQHGRKCGSTFYTGISRIP